MKNIISIFIFTICSFTVFGQLQFGVKGGFNLSDLVVKSTEIDETNLKIGLTAGAFARIPISEWLVLQPEMLYTTKGSKYKYDETTVKANASYLDIPVLASIQVFGTPVSINLGPQFSILTNAKYKYSSPIFANETVIDDDRNSFNEWDLGGAAGIAVTLDKIQFEFRATRGIRKVENDRIILNQTITARDTKNFGLQLTAGLIF